MLDFSWAELLILIAVAVFVIGPKDIPNVMYGLGRVFKRFQYIRFAISRQFDDVMQAHDVEELRRGVNMEVPNTDEQKADVGVVDIDTLYQRIAAPYVEAFQEPSDHIDDFIQYLPEKGLVLDVGCGTGTDSFYLEQEGFNVKAFDLSDDMLAHAKSKGSAVHFTKADLKAFEYGEGEYDGIMASYSFIHLPKKDVPQVISKICRGLKEGGHFFIGVQSGASEEAYVDEPMAENTRFFLNVIAKDELQEYLENAGFKIEKIFERASESEDELNYTKLCMIAKK